MTSAKTDNMIQPDEEHYVRCEACGCMYHGQWVAYYDGLRPTFPSPDQQPLEPIVVAAVLHNNATIITHARCRECTPILNDIRTIIDFANSTRLTE